MWQNILPHVCGWMNKDELFGWKMLIIEKHWITQVDEQGFKGLGIHSKSIVI
jgi:hypothetical protein